MVVFIATIFMIQDRLLKVKFREINGSTEIQWSAKNLCYLGVCQNHKYYKKSAFKIKTVIYMNLKLMIVKENSTLST